jgi:glycerol uptake facilitator-like aquaporin
MAIKKAVSKSVDKSTDKVPTKRSTIEAVAARAGLFSSPLKRTPFIGVLVAEFIGTFLLAASVIAGQGQPIIVLFALAGIVLIVGALSGAHLNPAVTVGAWATRRIKGLRALGYVVAQFLGALAAFGLLSAFVDGAAQSDPTGYGAVSLFQAAPLPVDKEWYVFFAELIGTTILGFVFANALKVVKKDVVAASLTAGFGIFVALLFAASAASYVGGSAIINPAVALSLQSLKWEVWPLAVYVLAPVIGGVVGFILYDILRVECDEED